jgi:fibronectin-binding autotransporter adhesin
MRIRRGTEIVVAACALLLLPPAAAGAKVFTPTRHGDPTPGACKPNDCSLREAVSAANSRPGPDTIVLRAGTIYDLAIAGRGDDTNAFGDLDVNGKLTIESSGQTRATIDANRVDRVLDAHSALIVSRLVIRGGETSGDPSNNCGCGINSQTNSPLTVARSKIVDNRTAAGGYGVGGGINKGGTGDLTVTRSVVKNNQSTLDGAGIMDDSFGARVWIGRSRIVANTGGAGGGFDEFGGEPVTIDHSTISGNHAVTNGPAGGGIVTESDHLLVRDSKILNNRSDGPGGGIANYLGRTIVLRSTIAGNHGKVNAGAGGGGIANLSLGQEATTVVRSSTVSGNRSNFNGGGIENVARESGITSRLVVVDSTIAGNKAAEFGGGVDSYTFNGGAESVRLNAVTIAYNDGDGDNSGTGFGGGIDNEANSGVFRLANTLVARNTAPVAANCSGAALISGGHNLFGRMPDENCLQSTQPSDRFAQPKIGQPASNGGPTKTIALLAGSPAINHAGSDAPTRDQRGVIRHDPDIGAFER